MAPAAIPAFRLYGIVAILLVLKILAVANYTSYLRIRRRVNATPEDYALQGLAARGTVDPDIERVRRAHQNDLENILPFLIIGLVFALTGPSIVPAAIYFIGFLVARVLHSVFYIASLQPHRTVAFALGGAFLVVMMVHTFIRLL